MKLTQPSGRKESVLSPGLSSPPSLFTSPGALCLLLGSAHKRNMARASPAELDPSLQKVRQGAIIQLPAPPVRLLPPAARPQGC